jgi:hypothetical protein
LVLSQSTAQTRVFATHPIEGKFGQGKNGYRLNYIRAKRANTSFAWINSIFLVMNLLILERTFFALEKWNFAEFRAAVRTICLLACLNLRNFIRLADTPIGCVA